MTTVTTSSVGAGKTYSTVDLWADACPANLVTNDEIWKGELYNAELVRSDNTWQMSIGGITTSTTQYLWLTTATGEGFADVADPATDTLRYDSSRGASLRITGTYTRFFSNNSKHVLIEGVQMKHDNTGSGSWAFIEGGSQTYFRRCIMETVKTGGSFESSSSPKWINSLLIARGSGGSVGALVDVGGTARNCTLVRPDDLSTSGGAVMASFGTYPTVKNCAVFGKFNTLFDGTISSYPSGGYNASSVADTPGSNDQASKTYSSQFENVNDSTRDWRVKSTADLVNNGTRDQGTEGNLSTIGTNDLDILGRARSTTTPTIGCWEYISGGGGAVLEATPAAVASATAALTTGIPLAAASAAAATATAALTTAIALAATPAAAATTVAALTTQIRLNATSAAVATVVAELASTAAALAATPAAAATVTAALTTQIRLNATPAAVATAVAELASTAAALAATPAVTAAVTAALTTQIRLNATPAAEATVTGALTTQIRLNATLASVATVAAELTTAPAGLSAFPSAVAAVTGALTTAIRLNAVAVAQASATGELAAQTAALVAAPATSSSATGTLTTTVLFAAEASSTAATTAVLTTSIRMAAAALSTSTLVGSMAGAPQIGKSSEYYVRDVFKTRNLYVRAQNKSVNLKA